METNKVFEALGLARLIGETVMEETGNDKMTVICSTPKMILMIGKEIQAEYRRN